ncbi:MAG: hypothetical protein VW378_01455 [bacterium]
MDAQHAAQHAAHQSAPLGRGSDPKAVSSLRPVHPDVPGDPVAVALSPKSKKMIGQRSVKIKSFHACKQAFDASPNLNTAEALLLSLEPLKESKTYWEQCQANGTTAHQEIHTLFTNCIARLTPCLSDPDWETMKLGLFSSLMTNEQAQQRFADYLRTPKHQDVRYLPTFIGLIRQSKITNPVVLDTFKHSPVFDRLGADVTAIVHRLAGLEFDGLDPGALFAQTVMGLSQQPTPELSRILQLVQSTSLAELLSTPNFMHCIIGQLQHIKVLPSSIAAVKAKVPDPSTLFIGSPAEHLDPDIKYILAAIVYDYTRELHPDGNMPSYYTHQNQLGYLPETPQNIQSLHRTADSLQRLTRLGLTPERMAFECAIRTFAMALCCPSSPPAEQQLYRGVVNQSVRSGDLYMSASNSSFSEVKDTATTFINLGLSKLAPGAPRDSILFELNPEGLLLLPVSGISANPGENERIMIPGAALREYTVGDMRIDGAVATAVMHCRAETLEAACSSINFTTDFNQLSIHVQNSGKFRSDPSFQVKVVTKVVQDGFCTTSNQLHQFLDMVTPELQQTNPELFNEFVAKGLDFSQNIQDLTSFSHLLTADFQQAHPEFVNEFVAKGLDLSQNIQDLTSFSHLLTADFQQAHPELVNAFVDKVLEYFEREQTMLDALPRHIQVSLTQKNPSCFRYCQPFTQPELNKIFPVQPRLIFNYSHQTRQQILTASPALLSRLDSDTQIRLCIEDVNLFINKFSTLDTRIICSVLNDPNFLSSLTSEEDQRILNALILSTSPPLVPSLSPQTQSTLKLNTRQAPPCIQDVDLFINRFSTLNHSFICSVLNNPNFLSSLTSEHQLSLKALILSTVPPLAPRLSSHTRSTLGLNKKIKPPPLHTLTRLRPEGNGGTPL